MLYGIDQTPHYLSHLQLSQLQAALDHTKAEYKKAGVTDEKIRAANATQKPSEESSKLAHQAQIVFEHWKIEFNHPRALLDIKRKKRIVARLKNGFTVEQLKSVCGGVKNSPYHMGENSTSTIYDKIDTIYRDVEQVERFIELSKKRANGKVPVSTPCQFCEKHRAKPSIIPCEAHQPELFKEYFERKNVSKKNIQLNS